jgi:DNA-binding NarL/FixJ family response regulator
MPGEPSPRTVLLVEDNPADADLVREMMEESEGDRYRFRIVHSTRISDALGILSRDAIDVILLDLGLPDSSGAETLVTIHALAGRAPIVVLSGRDDDALAMQCIDLGAQDYLSKSEIRPVSLRRSIGYAIARSHDAEIRDLRDALERYRDLSTTAMQAATPADCGALRDRAPEAFGDLAEEYTRLLRRHFDGLVVRVEKPRTAMTRIVTLLGNQGAGPRDLVDVHAAALSRSVEGSNTLKARTLALEGRLLALEMMGLLVEYYRVRNAAPRR